MGRTIIKFEKYILCMGPRYPPQSMHNLFPSGLTKNVSLLNAYQRSLSARLIFAASRVVIRKSNTTSIMTLRTYI